MSKPIHKTYLLFKKRLDLKTHLLLGLGLIVASLGFLSTDLAADLGFKEQTTSNVVASDNQPDENKPDPSLDWYVPADNPRRIIAPSIGVDGFVQSVGRDDANKIDVPDNIHVAGWFDQSSKIGDKGLSIIAGHLRGVYSHGIFYDLDKLRPGDTFMVELGDKTIKTYEVMNSTTVNTDDAFVAMYERSQKYQLNLVTCTGPYQSDTNSYPARHIVYAKML